MKHFIATLVLIFTCCISLYAAPKSIGAKKYTQGKATIYGAVALTTEFSGNKLFAVLDSVGGGGNWMEWDINGLQDPSIMNILSPMLKSNNKPKMVWVITERKFPLVAVLLPKGAGEVLMFYEIDALDAKPVPITVNAVLTPAVVFRDYKQISETEFVHIDKENLKVNILKNGIRFSYTKKDTEPLHMSTDFLIKSKAEKQLILQEYMDFFSYEYSLMLRAFVQSVRSVFNWQPWHWYIKSFNKNYIIKKDYLEAILEHGVAPQMFTLFRANNGCIIEFKTDACGYYELTITQP